MYPDKPDLEGEFPAMSVEGTVAELRLKYPSMNRSEMIAGEKGINRTFVCNVKLVDGQLSPLFLEDAERNLPLSNL